MDSRLTPYLFCPEGAFCVGEAKKIDVRSTVRPSVRPVRTCHKSANSWQSVAIDNLFWQIRNFRVVQIEYLRFRLSLCPHSFGQDEYFYK